MKKNILVPGNLLGTLKYEKNVGSNKKRQE